MADLKAGTTVGGAMVWTQGNFPLFPSGNTLLYRDYTVYTTNDKPQAADNDFVSKSQGGTFEKTITMKGSISSSTMMQLQGTAVGTQYSLTDSSGALTGSNYQIYAQGDQFKFRGPNTVGSGLIDVLLWTNSTKRFDLSGNLYVSGSMYNLYDSTGGIFYSPKNKPTTTDIGLGNVTNDAQLKIASNLSDVANVDTARANISAAKSGVNSDITSLTALDSSLRLGADGSNPQDATTLRQMQSAISAVSSSGGINGVMSTFIGDVSWWVGTASNIPTGYVLPVGQLSLRSDYPEIWALIDAGVFRTTNEAQWNTTTATSRAFFTTGTVTSGDNANFRWPDLNAGTSGSIGGLFLRGANGPNDAGAIGVTRLSAAPNIVGTWNSFSYKRGGGAEDSTVGAVRRQSDGNTQPLYGNGNSEFQYWTLNLNASNTNSPQSSANLAYGRDGTTEVRPNSVSGYWIIRAKGTFSAQTSFGVFTSSDQLVANAVKLGGAVRSVHTVGGVDYGVRIESQVTTDANKTPKTLMKLSVEGGSGQAVLDDTGQFSTSSRVTSRTIAISSSGYEMNFTNMANGTVQINRTSNINQLNFGGINVYDVLSYFGLGNMVTRGNFDTYVATGSLVGQNGPSLRSSIRDGGTQDGRVRANFDLFALCDNGGQRKGILRVHSDAFTQEYNWYFNGSGNYAGRIVGSAGIVAIEGSSDAKLKVIKSAVNLSGALDRINAFEMKEYYWNNHRFNKQRGVDINQLQRGVIAQQIEKINPAYVNTSQVRIGTAEDGYNEEIKTLDTNAILMDALASIQALSKQVKELQEEVKTLRG